MNQRTLLALTLLTLTLRAQAETFVVTRLDDPMPGGCLTDDCSLREAALAANANDAFTGTDTIQLAAGTYTLTGGPLTPDSGLSLVGAGATQTHVITDVALFNAVIGKALSMRGMSIQTTAFDLLTAYDDSHLLLNDVAVPVGGGAILAGGAGSSLEVHDSEFRGVLACSQSPGTCTIVDSSMADFYAVPDGGGPVVLIQRSIVDGNLDPGAVPAPAVVLHGGTTTIEDSTITHTAGLHIRSEIGQQVNLLRVRYIDNNGPISTHVYADVTIKDSELRDNNSRAIYADSAAHVEISGSSFIHNSVDDNAGGAVLAEHGANVSISNSTFSGNSFSVTAAQAGARGAAIGYRNGGGAYINLRHVTIVAPTIAPFGIQGLGIGGFGGVGDAAIRVTNSILAGSCHLDAVALLQDNADIESPGNTCGLTSANSLVSVSSSSLALGTLGDHGGPTPTYAPATTSVALDAAVTPLCLDFDQRGYTRPFGAGCDIGAVEIGSSDRIFADGFQ
ncbi:MAG: right-handed parallel beta-helix repeat-containing protein [Dokdonella sp.]